MPTENRSSNTEMVSVPRDLAEEINSALYDHDLKGLTVRLQELLDKPEPHQGDPVTLPACIAKLGMSHDWDQGYADGWKGCLEEAAKLGPLFTRPAPAVQTADPVAYRHIELDGEKGMWFDAHPDSLKSARDDVERGVYGKAELAYGVADAGEVERLRNCLRTEIDAGDSWKREAEDLRAQLAEMTKSYESLAAVYAGTQKGFERLQAQLAERDALLFRLAYYLAPALEANAPYMSAETMHDALSALNEHRKLLAAARSSNTEPVEPEDRKFGSMTARFAVEAMGSLTKS